MFKCTQRLVQFVANVLPCNHFMKSLVNQCSAEMAVVVSKLTCVQGVLNLMHKASIASIIVSQAIVQLIVRL